MDANASTWRPWQISLLICACIAKVLLIYLLLATVLVQQEPKTRDYPFDDFTALSGLRSHFSLGSHPQHPWREQDHPCLWHGVTCNDDMTHITELRLTGIPLNTALPDCLSLLSNLKVLDVSNCNLRGLLPKMPETLMEFYGLGNQFSPCAHLETRHVIPTCKIKFSVDPQGGRCHRIWKEKSEMCYIEGEESKRETAGTLEADLAMGGPMIVAYPPEVGNPIPYSSPPISGPSSSPPISGPSSSPTPISGPPSSPPISGPSSSPTPISGPSSSPPISGPSSSPPISGPSSSPPISGPSSGPTSSPTDLPTPGSTPYSAPYGGPASNSTPLDPPSNSPPLNSAPLVNSPCGPPPIPSDGFTCDNTTGKWTFDGDIEVVTLTVLGPVAINGNISSTAIIFENDASITVLGCVNAQEIEIRLTKEQLEKLRDNPSERERLLILSSKGNQCASLDSLPVKVTSAKSCIKASSSSRSGTEPTSNKQTLTAVFSIGTIRCKLWWIILLSVLGGVLILIAIVVLLSRYNKRCKNLTRPFAQRKHTATLRDTT